MHYILIGDWLVIPMSSVQRIELNQVWENWVEDKHKYAYNFGIQVDCPLVRIELKEDSYYIAGHSAEKIRKAFMGQFPTDGIIRVSLDNFLE